MSNSKIDRPKRTRRCLTDEEERALFIAYEEIRTKDRVKALADEWNISRATLYNIVNRRRAAA